VAVGAVGSGLLVDGAVASGLVPPSAIVTTADAADAHHHHQQGVTALGLLQHGSAVALLLVLANALRPRRRDEGPEEAILRDSGESTELRVVGMHCNGCVQSVERALGECGGVTGVEVRLEEGRATVRGRDVSRDALEAAVRSLGFSVEG
jgi:copper chaperone CopZ